MTHPPFDFELHHDVDDDGRPTATVAAWKADQDEQLRVVIVRVDPCHLQVCVETYDHTSDRVEVVVRQLDV